jgi:hypothetical protein
LVNVLFNIDFNRHMHCKIPSLMSLLSKYVEIIHFKDTKDGKDSILEIVYHVII